MAFNLTSLYSFIQALYLYTFVRLTWLQCLWWNKSHMFSSLKPFYIIKQSIKSQQLRHQHRLSSFATFNINLFNSICSLDSINYTKLTKSHWILTTQHSSPHLCRPQERFLLQRFSQVKTSSSEIEIVSSEIPDSVSRWWSHICLISSEFV